MSKATPTGAAADEQQTPTKTDPQPPRRSARDEALEALTARQEEARRAQVDDDVAHDEGLAAMRARIETQQKENRARAEEEGLLDSEQATEQGVTQVKKIETEATDKKDLPDNLQDDPLAEYIEMREGKPMFAIKVNGEARYMELGEARKKLQIGTAAEIRMQNAAAKEKEVLQREQKLTAAEQALQARVKKSSPGVDTSTLDEAELRKEAGTFLLSAFRDDEEVAADKLTKLLLKVRTPSAAPIDEAALVEKTTSEAITRMSKKERDADLVSGYKQLEDQYPMIFQDANLYTVTDRLVDEIVKEHPEWPTSQAMLEAGKRAYEWKGIVKAEADSEDTTEEETTETTDSQIPASITQIRQERKTGLTRLPQTAASAIKPASKEEKAPVQTPQEALAEVRRARGQPV